MAPGARKRPPGPEPPDFWSPSRREQAWDWRARRLMRYVVGPAVIGWELVYDKGHNLIVLIVGAMLSTSTDVLGVIRTLIAQARMEQKSIQDLLDEEEDRR